MKFLEMVKFLETLIMTNSDTVTPEDVQYSIDQHGYGRESLYRHLKRKLCRILTEDGLPALTEDFIERECHRWIYNRAI